jgi:hypothetical protein
LIEEKREELGRVCRRHRVHRIELFGSAIRPDFNSAHSDLVVRDNQNAIQQNWMAFPRIAGVRAAGTDECVRPYASNSLTPN